MDFVNLENLERLALRWPILRRFVLRAHADAFRGLVEALPSIDRVGIVGGGVFPRTALILERLLPGARLTIIDANLANLDQARGLLWGGGSMQPAAHGETTQAGMPVPQRSEATTRGAAPVAQRSGNLREARRSAKIDFVHARYPQPAIADYDLLVIPLSFLGDRAAIYQQPPAAAVILHD